MAIVMLTRFKCKIIIAAEIGNKSAASDSSCNLSAILRRSQLGIRELAVNIWRKLLSLLASPLNEHVTSPTARNHSLLSTEKLQICILVTT